MWMIASLARFLHPCSGSPGEPGVGSRFPPNAQACARTDDQPITRRRIGGCGPPQPKILVQPWVGNHIDDHAAAGEMDADRQAIREVPDSARVSIADGDVRQIGLSSPASSRA